MSKKLLVLVFALALIATACGSSGGSEGGGGGSGTESTQPNSTIAAADVPTGGTLTIGAEQEPDCADWMGSCGGSSWGFWMMGVTTMPRSFDILKDKDGNYQYVPSILLTGEPELKTDPKQVVTYKINPKAVWSDGQPITSADFKYTWEQVTTGSNIYDTTGFANIESVDDSDPSTAVVTFKTTYPDWKGLFGGQFGIFPSHILKGKDRDAETKDGYAWSAGPWKIKWNKGDNITLTPNDKYWGDKPKLDSVVFKFQADTAAEFSAFKSDQVAAIYPQPQIDAVDQIKAGLPNTKKVISTNTGNFESLWINNSKPPFNDPEVRKALAYSIDREAVVKRLFGPLGVEKPLNVLNAPIVAENTDTEAFADYKLDLKKSASLLEGAGWTKGSDGIYEKAGKKLSFSMRTTAGNKRRELTEQAIQSQLKEAGFDMKIENAAAGDLFGDILPKGDFDMGIYAQVLTTLGPSVCTLFCSKNIPTAANEFSGNNWTRTNIPELDKQLNIVDTSLDPEAVKTAAKAADKIMAENVISLPIDPLPNILLWSDKVVGPIDDNSVLGPFWNLNQWGLQK